MSLNVLSCAYFYWSSLFGSLKPMDEDFPSWSSDFMSSMTICFRVRRSVFLSWLIGCFLFEDVGVFLEAYFYLFIYIF